MNEYRVTRPELYPAPSCPGYHDLSARQGHYIEANSPEEARSKFRAKIPEVKDERLDVTLWRSGGASVRSCILL